MPKDKKTNGLGNFRYQPMEFYQELDRILFETQFNILLLEPLMRHLLLVDKGTGWHQIEMVIREHRLATIKGADTQKVELPITLVSIQSIM